MPEKQKIYNFVTEQLNIADAKARAYIFNDQKQKIYHRNIYVRLEKYVKAFTVGQKNQRWISISGLRGTGKTTLMSQIYHELHIPRYRKLFVSVDHIVQLLNSSLHTVLEIYEEILGQPYEKIEEPIYLFLDEVQYDPNWAITLKSIYDRSKNIFIISTGSSALEINNTPDTARRVITETILPMSFTEYEKISHRTSEVKGLSKTLQQTIVTARNAHDIYYGFKQNSTLINNYWTQVDRFDIEKYLQYGTLPYMAIMDNPMRAFDLLERSIDRVLSIDVAKIGQFDNVTLGYIGQILYALADSDVISIHSLSKAFQHLTRPTITKILASLEQAEILYKLSANSSHMTQSRRSDKYVFTTPAIRAMYYALTGSIKNIDGIMSKLLEDAIVMYLRRIFGEKSLTRSITYGDTSGAADFILRNKQNTYVIEAGIGKKTLKQIYYTPEVSQERIGIVVSNNQLAINEELNTVIIPINQFLLL